MRPTPAAGLVPLTNQQATRAAEAFGLLRAGDATAALPIAQELVRVAPGAVDAQQLLALCLAELGRPAEAEMAFRRALQLAPGQPAILANLALLLRRNGRLADALACWQQAATANPGLAAAWLELGLIAAELAQSETAEAALRKALGLNNKLQRGWHGLGNVQRARGDLDAAEASFRQALALDPTKAAIWVNLAAVLRLLGRPDEAIECFQTACRLQPPSPEVLDALVGSLLDATRIEEAFSRAQELTAEHPQYVPGHTTLANLCWEYGPADSDPLQHYRAAAEAQPHNHSLQLGLISFLLEAKRSEEALERLQALRRQTDHPTLLALQANALELLGRADQAGLLYAQAHAVLGSSEPSFLTAYVRHLLKAGQWDAAAARAEDALARQPHNQEAWAYLATAWRLLEDPREHWLCDYEHLVVLLEVEPPAGYADMESFLQDLRPALEALHKARTEPVRQSLRAGSQTPGRLFGRPDPLVRSAQQALLQTIERWLAGLPTEAGHPFLGRVARSVQFTGSWSVKLWRSGNHVNHFHSDGWMSSAFYVALPPSVRTPAEASTAGHIQFGQPPVELGLDLAPRRVIQPRVGHLALFPSYLWHGTVPFYDDEPRITIAFDMLPKA